MPARIPLSAFRGSINTVHSRYASYAGITQIRFKGHGKHPNLSPSLRAPHCRDFTVALPKIFVKIFFQRERWNGNLKNFPGKAPVFRHNGTDSADTMTYTGAESGNGEIYFVREVYCHAGSII